MAESKRWKEIDALYTMGIILVLIGHSHSSDWSAIQGTAWEKGIYFIYTFHMPLFYGPILNVGCSSAFRLRCPNIYYRTQKVQGFARDPVLFLLRSEG